MSISGIIENGLESAFQAAGDLVSDATLHLNTVSGFDFTTLEVSNAAVASIPVKVITYKEALKVQEGVKHVQSKVLIKSKKVLDFSSYSTIDIKGVVWNIEQQITGSKYHALVKISRPSNV